MEEPPRRSSNIGVGGRSETEETLDSVDEVGEGCPRVLSFSIIKSTSRTGHKGSPISQYHVEIYAIRRTINLVFSSLIHLNSLPFTYI